MAHGVRISWTFVLAKVVKHLQLLEVELAIPCVKSEHSAKPCALLDSIVSQHEPDYVLPFTGSEIYLTTGVIRPGFLSL